MLGRYSILVADEHGELTQWFLLRNEFGMQLQPARVFRFDEPVISIAAEPRRKGFAVVTKSGAVELLHTTSERRLARTEANLTDPGLVVFSPRSDRLLVTTSGGQLRQFQIDNEHPEISWSTLWSKVWYEGYDEPVHSWQSSSADTDHEPQVFP